MAHQITQSKLLERYQRAVRNPRLMMLYPPVSTGRPYAGHPDAAGLWESAPEVGSLYVHVPFCATRCIFCPFYAVVGKTEDYRDYVDKVLEEAALYAPHVGHITFSSVYLGGGSPSVLPPALIERLLERLRAVLRIDGDVCIEAHPANVTPRTVADWCDAGVTRVSLGVQSFDPDVLEACGRADTTQQVRPALDACLAARLDDVNVDLMYGLPEQNMDSWLTDLGVAAQLGVPSLTLYATVYLPAFQSRCEMEEFTVSTPEERDAMYDRAYDFLVGAGYPQPHFGAGAFMRGDLTAHRRNVSLGLPMLGLGTWAYSSSGPFAYHNRFPTAEWAAEVERGRLPIGQLVTIPEEERPRKYVIEALLLAYVSFERFRAACGTDLVSAFPGEIAVLDRLGLVKFEEDEMRLTRKGGHHLREIRYLFASEPVVEAMEAEGAQGL